MALEEPMNERLSWLESLEHVKTSQLPMGQDYGSRSKLAYDGQNASAKV